MTGRQNLQSLYDAHASALLAYLRSSFGRFGSAEDMLQETFLQAMRHPHRLDRATSQRARLFGIARNVGLTVLRKHRPADALDESKPFTVENIGELDALREAIAGLPQNLREPLQLRLREGLSYEEIAQVMEIPLGTVRSRLHTAMQKLRDAMEA